MADPQPQSSDQGFLPGLLGKVRDFFPDPAAAYGGLLSDEATRRAFAWRELGAAAGAFSQGAMPVPYKGGIPFGATLGAAGAAASTAGDALMHARLEQAQQQQALANVGLSQQQVTLMQAALPGLKSLISTGQDRLGVGGSGTGTAAPGTPAALTGVGAGPRGVQAGGISPTDHYTFLLNNGASKNEATMLTSAANSESSFRPDLTHDHDIGYGLYGHNTDRLAAMRTYAGVGPNDPVPWQQQALFALAELRGQVPGLPGGGEPKAGAMVNAATNAQQLTDAQLAFERPNLNIAGGNRAQRLASTTEYLNKPPYAQSPTQTASAAPSATPPAADLGPQTASGGAYSVPPPPGPPPKPGEYAIPVRAGNVPLPPAAPAPAGPPMAQPAAPRGLLDTSQGPLGSSAAPPQLATPPAAGAPGPVTGLLGQQPTQQVAAADAPQLSPAAATILQGINTQQAGRGLLASGSVAGDNAVPTSEPSAAVTQQAIPHTGAAGAAELAGLLAQQPASAAPPTATPYTNAPPANGQGAPAPGPAPTGPPVAPSLNLPPIPSQMPAMPNLPAVQPTPQQQIAQGVAGLMALSGHPAPPWIDDLAKMPAQMAMEQYKAWVGGQANMMTEQYKKQIEVAAAGTISYLQSQGQLPADLTKMTTEQNLKLRNSMAEKGLQQRPDGSWGFMPGYIESEGIKAKQAQDAIAAREAQTPQKLGPTDMLMLPPGSPAAQAYRDAQTKNQKLPAGVTMMPDGSVQIQSLAPTSEQITANTTDLMKLKDQAQEARQGMYETQQLRQQLHGIGMSGPATEIYAGLGAWAQSLGILNQDQVKKYIGLNPAAPEAADKMSQDLLGEVLKTTFPGRITNADVTLWKNTVPRGTQLQAAYDLLIDKILMPKFEQTVGRYGSVAQLPSNDPQLRTYTQTLETYDKAHPLQSFVQQYAYAPDGSRMRLDKTDPNKPTWVPDAANPRAP